MHAKQLTRLVVTALILGSVLGMSAVSVAKRGDDVAKDQYVDGIVEILRGHIVAMRWILDHDIKYSDNMVRHANAFERTFGMIGPMDWHAAEAAELSAKGPEADRLSEAQFEELADTSMRKIHGLHDAAERYLRDKDKKRMRGYINEVIASCGACHSRLPEGTTPHVWQGLKE